MAMISTKGKLRMVKAMTGKAMPRIRLLEEKKLQWESGKNTEAPESVVLASKACDNVESRQPEEQQPGAVRHLGQGIKVVSRVEEDGGGGGDVTLIRRGKFISDLESVLS